MNAQTIANTPRFKWHGDQIVYEGKPYGWSYSHTPSVIGAERLFPSAVSSPASLRRGLIHASGKSGIRVFEGAITSRQ